jgi:hypothetical protein
MSGPGLKAWRDMLPPAYFQLGKRKPGSEMGTKRLKVCVNYSRNTVNLKNERDARFIPLRISRKEGLSL